MHDLKWLRDLQIRMSLDFVSTFTSPPVAPLHSLGLHKDSPLDQESIAFISHFAKTLTTLEVGVYGGIEQSLGSLPLFTTEFPSLRFLHLSNSAASLLSSSHSFLPSLQTLRVTSVDGAIDEIIPPLREHVRQISSLETVEFVPNLRKRHHAPYTRSQFLSNSFELQHSDFEDYDQGSSILLDDYKEVQQKEEEDVSKDYIEDRRRPLRDVLRFGLQMEKSIAITGDVQKMAKLAQATRPLLMLKEFEED
ncbi:hypothetical protein JCM5350_005429 [Sporobolomyces pararoseus]